MRLLWIPNINEMDKTSVFCWALFKHGRKFILGPYLLCNLWSETLNYTYIFMLSFSVDRFFIEDCAAERFFWYSLIKQYCCCFTALTALSSWSSLSQQGTVGSVVCSPALFDPVALGKASWLWHKDFAFHVSSSACKFYNQAHHREGIKRVSQNTFSFQHKLQLNINISTNIYLFIHMQMNMHACAHHGSTWAIIGVSTTALQNSSTKYGIYMDILALRHSVCRLPGRYTD